MGKKIKIKIKTMIVCKEVEVKLPKTGEGTFVLDAPKKLIN